MITVTSQPPSITLAQVPSNIGKQPPVPLSDCWEWCLQPDDADAVDTAGGHATVTVAFPATPTVPANGTALKIWGYDFTVNNGSNYTGTTFKVTTNGLETAIYFGYMIQANLFFNDAVEVNVVGAGAPWQVILTWRECREQPRFVSEQMVFTAITATGGTGSYLNGASPVYVDGFKVITRVGYWENTDSAAGFKPLSPKVGLSTDQQCDTVGPVCVDYRADVETVLFTRLPELTSTSFITAAENGASMMRLFSLEYGWAYRENCQARSGTMLKSDLVLGLNAAFDIEDEYQVRRYWFGHPDGYPSGQFVSDYLTTQPKRTSLCWDSFAWLWLLNSWQVENPPYTLVARFSLYGAAGTIVETFEHTLNIGSWRQPSCFNVSPQFVLDNAPTLTEANLTRYDVQVVGRDGGDPLFNASEYLTFLPSHCCEGTTDLYVLTPAGGFATQSVEVLSRSVTKDGQEINLQVPCGGSRSDRAKYGGRTMVNLRTYEKVDFVFRLPNTPESVRWMKHVRQSPQTMLRVYSEGAYSVGPFSKGNPLARKFIVDPSTVDIYTVGEGLEFKATGYLGDIPVQRGVEP